MNENKRNNISTNKKQMNESYTMNKKNRNKKTDDITRNR